MNAVCLMVPLPDSTKATIRRCYEELELIYSFDQISKTKKACKNIAGLLKV